MSDEYEEFGIGVLRVSPCVLADFATQKPDGLEIIGTVYNFNSNAPCLSLIVKGPMIPTILALQGLPEVECLVTKLEDGSLEWEFNSVIPKSTQRQPMPLWRFKCDGSILVES